VILEEGEGRCEQPQGDWLKIVEYRWYGRSPGAKREMVVQVVGGVRETDGGRFGERTGNSTIDCSGRHISEYNLMIRARRRGC